MSFGDPVSTQIAPAGGILVIQMPLQRIPPAEDLEATPDHLATFVHCGASHMRSTGMPLRHTTTDPFVLLQGTSVSLEVAFEIGGSSVELFVSTHAAGEITHLGGVEWGSELSAPGPSPLETRVSNNGCGGPRPEAGRRSRAGRGTGRWGIGTGTICVAVACAVAKSWAW